MSKKKLEVIFETKEDVVAMFPVDDEPKIMTLDKPLIIQSSCPGWQVGGSRFPAVPCTIEEQAKVIADSVKAGAIAIHIHPRDPKTCLAQINAALLKEVCEAVFEKVGDCVTHSHTWYPIQNGDVDYIVETEDLLEWGEGNKYCQGTVVLPVGRAKERHRSIFTHHTTGEGIKWLEAHSVKPLYQLYDTSAQLHFKQYFDDGTSNWKPYNLYVNLGKHDSTAIHQDPESFLNAIANLGIVQKTFPGAIYGWRSGGRNWLPILIMGIMLGVDVVQVGIEDAYWRWPHSDEVIASNVDCIKWTVEIANILGRRVVTDPNEARKICGMKLTSKM